MVSTSPESQDGHSGSAVGKKLMRVLQVNVFEMGAQVIISDV
jgi:hypothetical protein